MLRQNLQKIEKEGVVPLKRAIQLLKQIKRSKFDETVEVHMWLGIDVNQSDQMIRGSRAAAVRPGQSEAGRRLLPG